MSNSTDDTSIAGHSTGLAVPLDGAASPEVTRNRQNPSITLFADTFSGVKATAASSAAAQTFGALGGSRHVELQAKPCVFGSDCSAIFYDEVHDSVITVQAAGGAKPGLCLSLLLDFLV